MAPVQHDRAWTVMVFMAGDNNLESAGLADLEEMQRAVRSDGVAVVAHFDRLSNAGSRRYLLGGGVPFEAACVAEITETNTGDPAALVDFVSWAHAHWPARRYALILWNHGSGVRDVDVYAAARRKGGVLAEPPALVRGLGERRFRRALFQSTVRRLVDLALESERGILFDDSSADFLDGHELQIALHGATGVLGQPLDLLGFDACLMSMVEIAWQVRHACRVLVGSQAVESRQGWPWDAICQWLYATPEATATDFGAAIVDQFGSSYRSQSRFATAAQSAICTERLEPVAAAVARLATALVHAAEIPTTSTALFAALRAAQVFDRERDYVDLRDYCVQLGSAASGAVQDAAAAVVAALDARPKAVFAERHEGPGLHRASGLSIYLPTRFLSPTYSSLDFAQATGWDAVLTTCLKVEA